MKRLKIQTILSVIGLSGCFVPSLLGQSRSQLTDVQNWALSLASILNGADPADDGDISGRQPGPAQRKILNELLSQDWGIENRDDLLYALRNLETKGHRA